MTNNYYRAIKILTLGTIEEFVEVNGTDETFPEVAGGNCPAFPITG